MKPEKLEQEDPNTNEECRHSVELLKKGPVDVAGIIEQRMKFTDFDFQGDRAVLW